MNSGDKLYINLCSFDDLLGLPSVGKATAYKIWELRKSTEITPEILATISHIQMEKVLPLIDFSTSQEVAESWYLEKSEDESEEGLDEDLMAYVHQAEEILKDGANLLQQHQTMKTEVPYGYMVSSPEYITASYPRGHHTVKPEPPPSPPPGPSGVSSQTSTHAPSRQHSGENYCSTPVTSGTSQRPQPRFLSSTVHPQPTVKTQVTINNPTQATYQDPTVANAYTYAYGHDNRQNQQMANSSAQMHPRLILPSSSVAEMPRPPRYYQQTPAPRHPGLHRQPTTNFNVRLQGLQPSHPVQSPAATDQYGLGPQTHRLTTEQVFNEPNLPTGPQQTHRQLNEPRTSHSQPTMLKCFKFDGTGRCEDWSAFLVKFEIFADASRWTDEEKRNQLCWCLTGPASRYGTNLIRHNKDISYDQLMEKMEQRFNHGNETETLQVQFHNARQSPAESTDEWADRLSSLADKAFRDVPEHYVQSQIITKFLQALTDKAAGKAASMLKPKSIEEACQLVKLSQHLDSSIYGVKHQEHSPYTEREREPVCQAVKASREDGHHNTLDSQMASMMEKMVSMQEATEKSLKELHYQVNELKKQRPPSNQNSRPGTFQCYSCGGRGHIARHCKKSEQAQSQDGKQDYKKDKALNQQGLVKRA